VRNHWTFSIYLTYAEIFFITGFVDFTGQQSLPEEQPPSNTLLTTGGRLQEMGINGLCDRGYEISLGSVQHEEAYARDTEDSPCEHHQTHLRVDGFRNCADCGELVE